ncbi:hypothetical protein ACLOJK_024181 [Asimina triloba]
MMSADDAQPRPVGYVARSRGRGVPSRCPTAHHCGPFGRSIGGGVLHCRSKPEKTIARMVKMLPEMIAVGGFGLSSMLPCFLSSPIVGSELSGMVRRLPPLVWMMEHHILSPAQVLHRFSGRARPEERSKKWKNLAKVNLARRKPTTLTKEEQENLASSPEASVDPISVEPALLESVPSPVPVRDVEGDRTSPNPVFELAIFEAMGREGTRMDAAGVQGSVLRHDADPSEARAPTRCGVLRSTFREASSCPSSEQVFHRPFDMEARAMKILGDLLPVLISGGILLARAGEALCSGLIPHRFRVTHIMDEEERRKIIIAGKRLEEVVVEQVSRERSF